jgi:hypothetical protein
MPKVSDRTFLKSNGIWLSGIPIEYTNFEISLHRASGKYFSEVSWIFRLSAGICRKVVLTGFFEIPHLG